MVTRQLLAIALAATLLIGGVAATGAALPQDAQPDDDVQDDDRTSGDAGPPDNTTQYEPGNGDGDAADRGNGSVPDDVGPDDQGPPTDMPEQVPDKVIQIHQTIDDFLSGDTDHLGDALSEFLGGSDAGAAEEDDAGVDEVDQVDDADEESDDADEEADADDADGDGDA